MLKDYRYLLLLHLKDLPDSFSCLIPSDVCRFKEDLTQITFKVIGIHNPVGDILYGKPFIVTIKALFTKTRSGRNQS